MTTVVLQFEFKTDARVGKSGPGDTLRLVHALQHPVFKDEELILLSTAPRRLSRFFTRAISRPLRLKPNLAPDIVAVNLDETLPPDVTLFDLAVDPPALWEEQRVRIAMPL